MSCPPAAPAPWSLSHHLSPAGNTRAPLAIAISVKSHGPGSQPGAPVAFNATGCSREGKKREIYLTLWRPSSPREEQSERCKIRQINPTSQRSTVFRTGAAASLFLEIQTKTRSRGMGVWQPPLPRRNGTVCEQVAVGGVQLPAHPPVCPRASLRRPPGPRPPCLISSM